MKKFFAVALFAIMACTSLFALTDSVYPYGEVPEFKAMMKAFKENHPYEDAMPVYEAYKAVCKDTYAFVRGEYEVTKYLVDAGYKKEAEEHQKVLEATVLEYHKEGGFLADAAYSDYLSATYYVDKNLSHALENNDALKKLYKKYPDEVLTILSEAWRNFYAPAIAGGSIKKAIEMFKSLVEVKDSLNEDVLYSAYTGLASAYAEKSEWQEAKKYLDAAKTIYFGEPYLVELENKINKKLK